MQLVAKRRLVDVVTGFFDPNAEPAAPEPPPALDAAAEEDEEEEEKAEGAEDEEAEPTGPDPEECRLNFEELQKRYAKAWTSLEKLGKLKPVLRQYDVGVDARGFRPVVPTTIVRPRSAQKGTGSRTLRALSNTRASTTLCSTWLSGATVWWLMTWSRQPGGVRTS